MEEVPTRDSRGGPSRFEFSWHFKEWFQKEKQRIEDEIREVGLGKSSFIVGKRLTLVPQGMQEAVSNMHIVHQNMEHLNDVGQEVVAISSVWVDFLRRMTASREKAR
ncbi:hypothetical protein CCR75_004191 [Bremia lactucae]|uniref:DASH complex subunit DAD1 n=1 Tax=Bremia lactucae TaxID=4779 RepID=A0A976FJQ4_BRELC|nr:hypothetical protein CCR75_004191 [Bremia lactucae]